MASSPVPTLFCSTCGNPTPGNAQFCLKCGNPLPAMVVAPASGQYGGFWIRVLATIIDGIVIGICCVPFVLFLLPGIIRAARVGGQHDPGTAIAMAGGMGLFYLGCLSINWLYEALMTSSAKQATLGKMALGMKVVDLQGRRISFGRATGRHFGKLLSGMALYIGFIMVAFTGRKQGLHDILASTLVVKS